LRTTQGIEGFQFPRFDGIHLHLSEIHRP
jgi:hypothetical protein